MKHKIFIALLLAALMLPCAAFANCVAQSATSGNYKVTASWPATVRHWSGKIDTGCLAEVQGWTEKVVVYSAYDFICKLPADEKIELVLLPSCCDTPPGSGIPCGASPKAGTAGGAPGGTNLEAVPEDLDRREIPELIARIPGELFYLGIAERLAKFMDDDDYDEDFEKYASHIKIFYHQLPDGDLKTETAKLWLGTDTGKRILSDRGDDTDDAALIAHMEKIYGDQLPAALEQLRSKPRHIEKFMPVLVDKLYELCNLRRIATSPVDRKLFDDLMDTVESFGPEAQDYLQQVYLAINAWDVFDAYGIPKAKRLEALMSGRNVPAYGRPASYRRSSVLNGDDEIAAVLVPRWEKLVCEIAPPAWGSKDPKITWDSSISPPAGRRNPVNLLPPPVACD